MLLLFVAILLVLILPVAICPSVVFIG